MNLLSERFFTLNSVQIYGRCSAEIACLFAVLLHEAMGRTILCVFSTRTICVNAWDCWTEEFIMIWIKLTSSVEHFVQQVGSDLKTKKKITTIFCYFKSPHVRESKTVLDSGFHTVDSGSAWYWIPVFVRGTLDFEFQSLVGFAIPKAVFHIPKSRIPDFPSIILPDSGFH